jgi:hypothetical protein
MIIETQIIKSKSELQSAIQKLKINRATIYLEVDRKKWDEIGKKLDRSRPFDIIIIEK